eukprot:TRINITY_DN18904_c0_g1_i1.p2 TRINITY_DN18904_c0_g1~~TRINITY_DN18904_c0_g1_i1.p2  ORF type:complete len:53 (+),score=8.30 TRINITY_DN18904_c0_g1_i1:77-235(+)
MFYVIQNFFQCLFASFTTFIKNINMMFYPYFVEYPLQKILAVTINYSLYQIT